MNRLWKINLVLLTFIFAMSAAPALAQEEEKLSKDQYNAALAKWQERETSANVEMERLKKEIASLLSQITAADKLINSEKAELFNLLSEIEAGKDSSVVLLEVLKAEVDMIEEEPSDEELTDLYQRLNELKQSQDTADEESNETLGTIESKLAEFGPDPFESAPGDTIKDTLADGEELAASEPDEKGETVVPAMEPQDKREIINLPRNLRFQRKADKYTVIRGDNLWKISGKKKIYDDPLQWIKIYTANREQIRDPNLIYIDQIFDIPREPAPNEHWVASGESLSSIAGKVLNNPFEWTKIYQANKSVIKDPNRIYRHQVLIIPKKKPVKDTASGSY